MVESTRLSACIAVEDGEQELARCIASCRDLAAEIVVLDRAPRAIVPEHPGTRRVQIDLGDERSARDLGQAATTGDWILLLDADEVLSDELRIKIRGLLQHGRIAEFRAFEIRRRHWVCGRPMRSMNLEPDYPLRFFARQTEAAAEYAPQRPLGRLEQPIERTEVARIDSWLRRRERRFRLLPDTGANAWALGLHPLRRFLTEFVGSGGWRDRRAGLIWAGLQASEEFLTAFYRWQRDAGGASRPRSS
jgi:hypothetical protein